MRPSRECRAWLVGSARRWRVGFRRPPTQLAFGFQIARRATAADADANSTALTANHSERHMKLNVKCSNGKTLNLEFDGAKTVLELKEAISAEDGNPPATQQRLIYSGKVLKDPETLDSYAVQEGHTIHMVRGAAPPASAPAPHAMIEREVRIEL